jgi:hypothetical protein
MSCGKQGRQAPWKTSLVGWAQCRGLSPEIYALLAQGKLIAEQYAPGITNATKLNSNSIIKSFYVNYMIGLRSVDGKISIDDLIGEPHWYASSLLPHTDLT